MTLPFAEAQKPNVAMGIVYGVAAGIVGGGIWWAVVFFAHVQFIYGALGVGALIGYGVLEGIRVPGKNAAVIAGVIAVLTVLMSEYFIVRSLGVAEFTKSGTAGTIPVWLGVTAAVRLIKIGIQENPLSVLFWGVTVFVAARMGLRGGNRHHRLVRRPDEPWTPVVAPSSPGPAGLSVPPPPPPAPFSPPSPPPPPFT
jgi:hypothetical protein